MTAVCVGTTVLSPCFTGLGKVTDVYGHSVTVEKFDKHGMQRVFGLDEDDIHPVVDGTEMRLNIKGKSRTYRVREVGSDDAFVLEGDGEMYEVALFQRQWNIVEIPVDTAVRW